MTRPSLVTKYRGAGQTECEVFQEAGGILVSLFTYGTAGLQVSQFFKPGSLATHWAGAIYAISPEEGIYKNVPPSTSGILLHAFTAPNTSASSWCMDWQTVFKNGKTQLFTMYHVAVTNSARMVFIDENDNVTETSDIVMPTPPLVPGYLRGLNFGNKIYTAGLTTNSSAIQITDPVAENGLQTFLPDLITYGQIDLVMHSGIVYGYTQYSVLTVGLGNTLWNFSSAIPKKELEWNLNNIIAPGAFGQCCIFSDGTDLVVMGAGSGVLNEEWDVWQINFDAGGQPIGITSVRDVTFGFDVLPAADTSRYYASRDIESSAGVVQTDIHMVTRLGHVEGSPIHHYKWNGVGAPATYLGVGGDSFTFDAPSWKVGGGARTFSNADELDFIVTNVAPTGSNVDITYLITGSAPASGVAMSVRFNNLKDSPVALAAVTPISNGFTSGNYIAGLTTSQSGIFRWDIAANGVSPSDIPNLSAILIRT